MKIKLQKGSEKRNEKLSALTKKNVKSRTEKQKKCIKQTISNKPQSMRIKQRKKDANANVSKACNNKQHRTKAIFNAFKSVFNSKFRQIYEVRKIFNFALILR